ncbi:MAG: hypothetical protein NC935_08950, partial [Candidatus Omnitrophica bacterium]|nr:hypothetical protein [Candidatus Omnitrophota bacterium]
MDVYSRPTSFIYRLQFIEKNFIEIIKVLGFNDVLIFSIIIFFCGLRFKKIFLLLITFFSFFLVGFFNYFVNLGQFLAPRYNFPFAFL